MLFEASRDFRGHATLFFVLDVRTSDLTGWGEWAIGQLTDSADWFRLRYLSIIYLSERIS